MKKIILAALLAAGTATHASAEGFYVGGAFANATVDFGTYLSDTKSDIRALGWTTASASGDDSSLANKFFGGYTVTENIAVELGYADLGKFSINARGTAGANYLTVNANIKATAFYVDVIGKHALSPQFEVFGKLGLAATKTKYSESFYNSSNGRSGSSSDSASEVNLKFGVGAQFNVSKAVGITTEWERYRDVGKEDITGEGDIDVLSVGLKYAF